jgi:hypothetical protein
MVSGHDKTSETDRERLLRRAREARDYVARVDPSLLGDTGVDPTLYELTLSRSVLDRLADAYRHELGNAWLGSLNGADPSGHR